jgi:RNA polymerase sigma-70 factor (ECF subfamily)
MALFHDSREPKMSWSELQEASDPELIRQLIAGNDDAFAVIVDRYQRLVFSVALRIIKDEGEAEDIVQTVFVDIFTKVGQFDPARGTLKVWLLQWAYSRSINRRHYLEHRQFYSRMNTDSGEVETAQLSQRRGVRFGGWSEAETVRLIRQALGSLKPAQQTAIELVYFEGLTLEEAAAKAGETVPAIRHHYYRGLAKLREFVNGSESVTKAEQVDALQQLEVGNLKPRPI